MAMHLTMVLARGSPGHFCQFCPLHALPLSFSPKSLESDVTKMMSEMLTRSSVQMVVRMRVLMILLVAKLAKRLKTMQTRPSRKPSGSTMLTLRAFALWCVSFLSIQAGVVERCLGDVATQAIANLSNLAIFCKNGTCDQAFFFRNPVRLYVYVINESSIYKLAKMLRKLAIVAYHTCHTALSALLRRGFLFPKALSYSVTLLHNIFIWSYNK